MPTGLPFRSMPAAVAGTPKLLGNLRTGQEELVYPQQLGRMERDPVTGRVEPVYTEADYRRGPDPAGRPVVEMAPAPERQEIPDPMLTLTQQSKAALDTALTMVKGKREELQKSIQPDREAAYRDYLIDFETLNKSKMEPEQKRQRAQALYAQYRKKAYGVQDKIRGDLDALTQAEQQTKAEIELKRLTTQAGMGAVAAIAQEQGWSPYETKRQQLRLLGMTLPAEERPKELTPLQEIAELTKYRDALQDTALNVRFDKNGNIEENISGGKVAEWVTPSPERAAYLEQVYDAYAGFTDAIERKAMGLGRPSGINLTASAARAAAPSLRRRIASRAILPWAAYDWIGRGLSPIAQGVAQARAGAPAADPNDVSRLSDAELRRIAGGAQ